MSIAIATAGMPHAPVADGPAPAGGLLRRGLNAVGSAAVWLFGVASLLLGLAVLSSVLVGQFIVLGYLLEASGRVARSGRLRDGFVGVRTAARLGGVALGCAVLWLPLYAMSIYAENAAIIDPGGAAARQWQLWLMVLAVLYAIHVAAACLRSAQFRYFLWPFNIVWVVRRALRGGMYPEARDRLWEFVVSLRLPYYFWLGLRGFAGALLWLLLPVALLGLGHTSPILGILGAAMLAIVVQYLPVLQARFARDDRLRACQELRAAREDYCRAPIALALAISLQLAAAVPLYLLKIEMIPRDLIFLEGLVFLVFMFPARLAMGWAYGRATHREAPRHWVFRWLGRLLVWPAIVGYVIVVSLSPHLGWQGVSTLYQQHAFLLPVPFVNWGE
jgi:hypothetical protein